MNHTDSPQAQHTRRQPAQALAHVLERPRVCRLDGIGDRRANRVGAFVQQLGRNSDRDGRLLPGEDDLDLALPGRRLDFRLHRTTVHKITGVERDGVRQRGKKQEPEDMLVEPLAIGGPKENRHYCTARWQTTGEQWATRDRQTHTTRTPRQANDIPPSTHPEAPWRSP